MPAVTLSQKWIEAKVRQPHLKRVDYFDAATPGLALTMGLHTATWYYFQRIDLKPTRMTLGRWPDVGIKEARAKAAEVHESIVAGKHPKAQQARQRAADREARARDHGRIVRHVAEAWSAQHMPQVAGSTRADYSRELGAFVEVFGDSDIGTIKRGAILRHLDRRKASSPSGTAANRAAVVIRQLFAFARDRYDLESNPVADVRNPTRQTKRSRTLDRAEIRVLWRACELAGYPYGHAIRLALCTGQRIGEVSGIRRSDIDSSGDYWKQIENKSSQRIDLFLASHSKAVLAGCPNLGKRAPYFSASTDKEGEPRPLRTDVWNNARVLNHAIGGLRAVYDHADYRPHVADALQRWDQELAAILKGNKPQIVSLSDRKREKRRNRAL
jgi:integrase